MCVWKPPLLTYFVQFYRGVAHFGVMFGFCIALLHSSSDYGAELREVDVLGNL